MGLVGQGFIPDNTMSIEKRPLAPPDCALFLGL
jgi:hypothetical protein